MPLFYQPQIKEGIHYLDGDESRHVSKALRLAEGSHIDVTDGHGFLYRAILTVVTSKKCIFEILETKSIPRRNYEVKIGIAPTKNIDRTEWFLEKAVEIGVDHIYFFYSENSERKKVNLERLIKKSVSAMKQSQQSWLPAINEIVPFSDLIKNVNADSKFIAHVDKDNPAHLKDVASKTKDYLLLIGPEGDFTQKEVQLALDLGFTKVSLGPNRLRTETAAVIGCHTINLINT